MTETISERNTLGTELLGKLMLKFAIPSIISLVTISTMWKRIFKQEETK